MRLDGLLGRGVTWSPGSFPLSARGMHTCPPPPTHPSLVPRLYEKEPGYEARGGGDKYTSVC